MRLWEKVELGRVGYVRGDIITISGSNVYVLEIEWRGTAFCRAKVTRHHHIGLFGYRVGESLRLTKRYIVVLLDAWGLASWSVGTVPTWRDVYLVEKLADAWSRHKSKGVT